MGLFVLIKEFKDIFFRWFFVDVVYDKLICEILYVQRGFDFVVVVTSFGKVFEQKLVSTKSQSPLYLSYISVS